MTTTQTRKSASNRPIDTHMAHPRARLDFTDGARRPGSPSGVPSAPATAFAYDQKLGNSARLLMAGQMNYMDDAPGGGIATIWLADRFAFRVRNRRWFCAKPSWVPTARHSAVFACSRPVRLAWAIT